MNVTLNAKGRREVGVATASIGFDKTCALKGIYVVQCRPMALLQLAVLFYWTGTHGVGRWLCQLSHPFWIWRTGVVGV